MSEYWVSKKKYFCKYCDIYIADDVPSRQHHENGLRHKGNVERYIRGIYKAGVQKKKDAEEEKREMARVELAARAAFAQDVSSGNAKASSAPVASTSAPRKAPTKPSNPFSDYTTAAQLGIEDPDIALLELRKAQGLVGEWQVVESGPSDTQEERDIKPSIGLDVIPDTAAAAAGDSNVKRPAEAPPEEDTRSFKLQKKTAAVGLGEIYDPGLIPVKIKKKEEPEKATESSTASSALTNERPKWTPISLKPKDGASATTSVSTPQTGELNGTTSSETDKQTPPAASRWSKVKWDQPIAEEEATAPSQIPQQPTDTASVQPPIKTEENDPSVKSELDGGVPTPAVEPPAAGLFKKRKAPVGARRGRR